jgi:hypothetical protein
MKKVKVERSHLEELYYMLMDRALKLTDQMLETSDESKKLECIVEGEKLDAKIEELAVVLGIKAELINSSDEDKNYYDQQVPVSIEIDQK